MNRAFKLMLGVVAAAALVACGGGGGDAITVATANVQAPATASTLSAVTNTSFDFTAGVPAFGTTGTTTLAFTSASATPAFKVESGGYSASGQTTFGSCIFTVTSSTFPAGHAMALGAVIRINPCNIVVESSSVPANNTQQNSQLKLVLGTLESAPEPTKIVVTPSGEVTLVSPTGGTVEVGKVELKVVTGS